MISDQTERPFKQATTKFIGDTMLYSATPF